ncbi:hypothetical protein VQ060_00160 [Pseudomonas sp. KBN06P05117]|uniref:hypothetical protein n=1 Tax=Pseudomonas TaxID=286 RepID=UPI000F7D843E|nr:hypothetical protein [Pseudomonas aeruginosa]RTB30395.1 hypothetical protein EJ655_31225 [Pseudomonas aeruginosa]
MSSTQHQLIEQCATRLRGIVEALDNIHDTSPHRWSTDLDDVHSSAESLLAMINDQAPARSEASFEEWLANELEGEDGQPVPTAVCDIALARRAFNHWPKLEQPAKVGGVRFSAGVSSRLVVEAAQRLYEFESTPEKEAERIERLQAFREQLDPLNLAPHAKAFNEAPAEALKPEQAEAERPEVVGVRYEDGTILSAEDCGTALEVCAKVQTPLMTVAQHERITAQLHDALDESDGDRWKLRSERDAANERADTLEHRMMGMMTRHFAEAWRNRDTQKALDGYLSAGIAQLEQERDAALARVAELEKQEPVATIAKVPGEDWNGLHFYRDLQGMQPGTKLYAAPVAQAQHSVPGIAESVSECLALAQTVFARLEGLMPRGKKLPEKHVARRLLAELETLAKLAAAPGNSVPQAWLDVQAERRRQVTTEGWTPEHDDAHSYGQMARAAACYALAGSSAPNDGTAALLVSLAWPWDEQWWKPTTTRRDLVKACALGLAEIERLDRAAASQGGPSDA